MKNLSSKSLIFFLVLACFVLIGCDPSEEELEKGQNIDIERIEGKVLGFGAGIFQGDNTYTSNWVGKPYFWAKISYMNENGSTTVETFYGILPEVMEVLEVGMELPATICLTLTQLTKMEGEIVDMDRDLDQNKFWIVVSDLEGIRKYRVDMKTYYMLVHVGTKLPLDSFMIKN